MDFVKRIFGSKRKTGFKLDDPSVSSLGNYFKICALSTFLMKEIFTKLEGYNVDNPNREPNSQTRSDNEVGQNEQYNKDTPHTKILLDEVDSKFKELLKALSDDVSGFSTTVGADYLSNLENSEDVTAAIKTIQDLIGKETQSESENLKKENKEPQQRDKVVVSKATLYVQKNGEISEMVSTEIRSMLKTQLATQGYVLQLSKCDDATKIDVTNKEPVIVICFSASRLGTDVLAALLGITPCRNVAVMILHHKELHAQPSQSSDKVLTSDEYKVLGGIFDMAFTSKQGIYQCEMNKRAVIELADFIRKSNDEQNKNPNTTE